jgi:hypothetical protein
MKPSHAILEREATHEEISLARPSPLWVRVVLCVVLLACLGFVAVLIAGMGFKLVTVL